MDSLNDSLSEYRKIKTNLKSIQTYEKYIQRLKTFELQKWFAKPSEFSPIECARRGWFNLSKDTLKCVICSNILYHHSQSPLTTLIYNLKKVESVDEKRCITDPKSLVDKHNQNCPWRTLKVQDQYIQIDVYDEDKVYKNFCSSRVTFKKCAQLPFLDESVLEILDKNSIFYDEESKSFSKNNYLVIYILSSCGWFYNEQKDILQCDKCLRAAGLWLYKRFTVSKGEVESNENVTQDNHDFVNIFGTNDYETEDLVIKNLITKMVNSIVIENETNLKNSCSIQTSERVKRKLNNSCNEESIDKSKSKKYFNPLNEHHSWCPWLVESELNQNSASFNDSLSNVKKINRNMCLLNFEALKKFYTRKNGAKIEQREDKLVSNTKLKASDIINSDALLERIKSVQSILVNCTSQLSHQ